ncbi:MAG: hypothetical protein PVG11_05180 [Anaerolineae bacterium]|jgi:hypothetical protein
MLTAKRSTRVAGGLLLGLLSLVLSLAPASAQPAWTRLLEPVELTGSGLEALDGAPLDELVVYVYTGSDWQPIPYQFDEVGADGAYGPEDGLLDGDDALVLMAADLGTQSPPDLWPEDTMARSHPRYEIQVADPLSPGAEGWAYVYRSSSLATAAEDYVAWQPISDTVEALSYTLGFSPADHAGIEVLALKGGGTSYVDLLDRTKIRVGATCTPTIFPPFSIVLTEDDLAGTVDPTPSIDGPVRVGGGDVANASWFYAGFYRTDLVFDASSFEPPDLCQTARIDFVRLSTDWLDPAATGASPATYYDANTAGGVPIDGVDDPAVPALPVSWWRQVSTARGSLVMAVDAVFQGGTISNYYEDDATLAGNDTGDQQRFGDAGFRVDLPSGQGIVMSGAFVLGPDEPNEGAAYADYFANPFEVTTSVQRRGGNAIYLPLVMR